MQVRDGTTIGEDAAELIEGDVAIVLSAVDGGGRPAITRAWGARVTADRRGIAICAALTGVPRMREALERGEVAVNFTIPSTYRGVQVKGTVTELAEPTPDDLHRLEAQFAGFRGNAAQVGMTTRGAERLLLGPDFVRVTFAVRELYDQTPGPSAGAVW